MARRLPGCGPAAALVATLALATPLAAQRGGPGFLFKAPTATLSLRGGLASPSAGGDLFGFARDTLTLGRGDFAGAALAADLTIARPGSRLGIVLGSGYARAAAPSSFRHWLDNNDQEIEQRTEFVQVPLTVGLRYALTAPGRAVGSLAWVPARLTPYVSAGAGGAWYRFRQVGDFIDFGTGDVFGSTFTTEGWGAIGYGGAGVEYSLAPGVALSLDARYTAGHAGVGGDYSGFDRADLSGLTTTAGFSFRF